MSTEHPDPADLATDERLAASYAALVTDLATTLDLTAGATDATHPTTYAALTADLATTLDIDAGLAAVIGLTASPPPHHDLTPPWHTAPTSHRLGDHLRSLSHLQRLALRSHPAYSAMRFAVQLANSIYSARDRANALAEALDRARVDGVDLDHDLDHAFDHDLHLDLDLVLARDPFRDHDHDHELAFDRARARDLALALDRARALAGALDNALERARARAFDRALALARARDLARDFARALDRARDLALDQALDRARDLAFPLNLHLDLEPATAAGDKQHDVEDPRRRMIVEWAVLLTEMGDNFIGADLQAADQVELGDLTGVRWSLATMWPPSWENRVRGASVEIEPGIFEIREDDWKRSLTEADT